MSSSHDCSSHPTTPASHDAQTAPASHAEDFAAHSRQPLPASRKIRVQGMQTGVCVPMREISLTNGEKIAVYDTSGPYTDPTALVDLRKGLETVRSRWITARSATPGSATTWLLTFAGPRESGRPPANRRYKPCGSCAAAGRCSRA